MVTDKFNEIGASVEVLDADTVPRMRWDHREHLFRIDVQRRGKNEVFQLITKGDVKLNVLNTDKNDRHLLLMAKIKGEKEPQKFLCGHDERHWFTAAIPESKGVSTVAQAKQALKPDAVVLAEIKGKVKTKNLQKRHRRMNTGGTIHRQGEFMFIPRPDMKIDTSDFRQVIHRNEPIRRGRIGHPHMVEFLYRSGGEAVRVCRQYPNGLTEKEYENLIKTNLEACNYRWENRVRNAQVFAKGKVRHEEHHVLDLGGVWHEVHINTEERSRALQHMAFID